MHRSNALLRIALLLIVLLLAGCASAPDPPAPGKAQLWGWVGGAPKQGLAQTGEDGLGLYEADDGDAPELPEGAKLVDYRQIGPVFVELRGQGATATAGRVTITLENAQFSRTVYAVGVGGTVVIENRSSRAYTVYALHAEETVFEVFVAAGASSAPQAVGTFPGHLEVFTYEEDALTTNLLLASGPFALVEGGARYVLTDLKPGTYELRAWHERFPPIARSLTFSADQQQRIDLTFSVNELPKIERP